MNLRIVFLIFSYAIFSFYICASDLHYLVNASDCDKLLDVLIEKPQRVNVRDKDKNTLLHTAARIGNPQIIQLLFLYGADPDLENAKHEKAIDVAADRNTYEELWYEHLFENVAISSLNQGLSTKPENNEKKHSRPAQEAAKPTKKKCIYQIKEANAWEFISASGARYSVSDKILGEGKLGTVMLAQLVRPGITPWPNNHKAGDFIAIKFQQEVFEEEEVKALMRTQLFIDFPIFIMGTKYFALPMELIEGCTLWDQLLQQDPERKSTIDYFFKLEDQIHISLHNQVHKKNIAYQDNNLENIMVKSAGFELVFIDFGNAFLYKEDCPEFARLRHDDFIRLISSIFIFLEHRDYPLNMQNRYWIHIFKIALKYVEHYKTEIPWLPSAREMLRHYQVSIPPFLERVYSKNITDEMIMNYSDQYLKINGFDDI
jgi:hypothetical protein